MSSGLPLSGEVASWLASSGNSEDSSGGVSAGVSKVTHSMGTMTSSLVGVGGEGMTRQLGKSAQSNIWVPRDSPPHRHQMRGEAVRER